MQVAVKHQDLYSRGELLLRTFLGIFYIVIPHGIFLLFLGIWSALLSFATFWVVLVTGKFPEGIFKFQLKFMRWGIRLQASLGNLIDGYPAFGLSVTDDKTALDVEYPDRSSRGILLARFLFGWLYFLIPHGFCLIFRVIATAVVAFLAWWVVLFTGSYPQSWHEFNVGTIRWITRFRLYNSLMTDVYPVFSGKA